MCGWWGSAKERGHLEDLGINGRTWTGLMWQYVSFRSMLIFYAEELLDPRPK